MAEERRATQRRATEIRLALRKLNELLRDLPQGMIVELTVEKADPLNNRPLHVVAKLAEEL